MGKQILMCYWIGQEKCPPSPTLDQMPAYVDIVPLAFVNINKTTFTLDFGFLTQHFNAETIQGWIKTVKANGTKVLFSINDTTLGQIPMASQAGFVQNVVDNVAAWGVDGIDFDYEPSGGVDIFSSTTFIPLVKAIRQALPSGSMLTAPIYDAWLNSEGEQMLKELGPVMDYVSTMDYTGYIGESSTISVCETYASLIGGWEKLIIGISCMDKSKGDFTPYEDTKALSAYNPPNGQKAGAMLYTYSYDLQIRTGYPDGTWTQIMYENLPDVVSSGQKDAKTPSTYVEPVEAVQEVA